MILILSHNHFDEPTNLVIDWLIYNKANFKRINGDAYTPKNNFTLDLNNNSLDNDGNQISETEISVVWFRRWFNPPIKTIDYGLYKKNNFSNDDVLLIESYHDFLKNELGTYTNSIFSLFKSKLWIPDAKISRGGLNKLDVLIKAKKIGMKIPETIITSSKKELLRFYSKHKILITKPIFEVAPVLYKEVAISMFTKEVLLKDIKEFPEIFFPSLFQNKIEKSFEIRVFIYEKKCYSIAIFSQNDSQTKIDFRNYNDSKPNRNIPFELPILIKTQLLLLMNEVNLNTGSIDLIMDINSEIILLEINPVGQFGMVSVGGNYPLEKIIAENLIEKDKNYVQT